MKQIKYLTMKKVALVLAATLLAAFVLSSCGSTQECPAYGQANVEVEQLA
ncbi:MAG: hypothetical protein MJZ31_06165 [Bacteroidales bacterium]|nr:hypothetical protein [Bacteroidales bacterium]